MNANHWTDTYRFDMGASEWFYEVSYRDDVDGALSDLRDDVFSRGDYFRPWEPEGPFAEMDREELVESSLAIIDEIGDVGDSVPGISESVESIRAGGQPTSIEAARFLSLESGTHSILDCERVTGSPEVCSVAPLTDEELMLLFGSAKPLTETIRSLHDGVFETLALERYEGRFMVGYRGELPESLFFFGVSGD
jgi:hypothetical protein